MAAASVAPLRYSPTKLPLPSTELQILPPVLAAGGGGGLEIWGGTGLGAAEVCTELGRDSEAVLEAGLDLTGAVYPQSSVAPPPPGAVGWLMMSLGSSYLEIVHRCSIKTEIGHSMLAVKEHIYVIYIN